MRAASLVAVAAIALIAAAGGGGPAPASPPAGAGEPPRASLRYRADLIRTARFFWGMDAPVATMAAQIQQESAWRETARSPYAEGLAQFTPATAKWISGAYPAALAGADVYNPAWALRALVIYDRHLYDRVPAAASDCDRWAFTLSSYNGGLGWLHRDVLQAQAQGFDPARWWGNVEHVSTRARWAFEENRGYPRRILLLIQPIYKTWGANVDCSGVGWN